jgi:hypothetical protein
LNLFSKRERRILGRQLQPLEISFRVPRLETIESRVDEGSTFTVRLPRLGLEAGSRSRDGWGVRLA